MRINFDFITDLGALRPVGAFGAQGLEITVARLAGDLPWSGDRSRVGNVYLEDVDIFG